MDVKKIFIILITIVACVAIGALVLNTLLPNVTSSLINSAEDMIYKATKMKFDFNADNNFGDDETEQYGGSAESGTNMNIGVDGFGD